MLELLEYRQLYATNQNETAIDACLAYAYGMDESWWEDYLLEKNKDPQRLFDRSWAVPEKEKLRHELKFIDDQGGSGVQKFLAQESRDDFIQTATDEAFTYPLRQNHVSNGIGLVRIGVQYGYFGGDPLNFLVTSLFGLELGSLYAESHAHAQMSMKPLLNLVASVDEAYENQQIQQSKSSYVFNQAGVALLALEGIGVLAALVYKPYAHSEVSQKIIQGLGVGIPFLHTAFTGWQVLYDLYAVNRYDNRAHLALQVADFFKLQNPKDFELESIGRFIAESQEVYEGMYLTSCDLAKFMGNMIGFIVPVVGVLQTTHTQNPLPPVINWASAGLLAVGGVGYGLYGLWEVGEMIYDKFAVWMARHDAAFSMLRGESGAAEQHLLEMDAEFVVKRLLDRLSDEMLLPKKTTAHYLKALGIPLEQIHLLSEASSENPNARALLANLLGLHLRS
jgi:hypothetical protein